MSAISTLPVWVIVGLGLVSALGAVAVWDMVQTTHAILRVYPILGRLRYLIEEIGPELRQYIVTNDLEERPYDRARRSWVYIAAKGKDSAVGFGTQHDLAAPGQYHFLPSPFPVLHAEAPEDARPHVIGPHRPRPFATRHRVGIAPMSFGALSEAAVRALALGAAEAGIYINTGEGGLSPYHLAGGGDVIFQIGPAKYGVRTPAGDLDWARLREIGQHPQIRAVEIKVGQGAKPGKGGILPGAKVTAEIAAIRGIPQGEPSLSPNRFAEFASVPELVDFVERVKAEVPVPVGVKIVLGDPAFPDALARALAEEGRGPDYVSVDGAEGGTGAAPMSLTDHMGLPLQDALVVVDDAYRRWGVRDRITIIGAGRLVTGADVAHTLALGADLVNIGRGFLFSIGCIQALRCHTNSCPTGVTTQNAWRQRGLVPTEKRSRVANYARAVQEDLMVVTRSLGLHSPGDLAREHLEVVVAIGQRMRASDLYPYPPLALQALTSPRAPEAVRRYAAEWAS
ncbi:MAG: FMN-binding glutamate synthase family protein [Dehalococcoidia bacterium]